MTQEEATRFVRNVLQELWDKWQPSDFQFNVWVALLRRYDYNLSEAALRRWYAYTERHATKPFPGQVRKALIPVGKEEMDRREPRKEFGLARAEKPNVITWFFINTGRQRDEREIQRDAEKAKIRQEELYGGDWIIILPEQSESQKMPQPGDALEGIAALREAEARIINGPDSPGKRFLIRAKRLSESVVL